MERANTICLFTMKRNGYSACEIVNPTKRARQLVEDYLDRPGGKTVRDFRVYSAKHMVGNIPVPIHGFKCFVFMKESIIMFPRLADMEKWKPPGINRFQRVHITEDVECGDADIQTVLDFYGNQKRK